MSDQQDTFEVQIEELSNDMQSQNDQTNQDIGSLQKFDQTVTEDLNNLASDIADLEEQTQLDIDTLQQNMAEANSKIDEVEEHHNGLRMDFEYLKYDFRSFTNEISKWQIDVDERLNQTEIQIQGNFYHSQRELHIEVKNLEKKLFFRFE